MTIFDKYDFMVNLFNDNESAILDFAVDIYGLNDETLGNVTYYLYGIDDIDSWIEDAKAMRNE